MSDFESSAVRTLEYLMAKYPHAFTQPAADTRVQRGVDRAAAAPLTREEVQRIQEVCRKNSGLSSYKIAALVGRSFTIVSRIRRGKHRLCN